ncbi:MAG: glutathione synthase [Halothiobacillaceae bacterium]|nr:MAG: glutathione synthase [Halothiobacillaceae bacterium]
MPLKLGVIMDPIGSIKPYKDSTFAMLLEVQRRGWQILYMEQGDLFMRDGRAYGNGRTLTVHDNSHHWHDFTSESRRVPLGELDVILMRKDPPFDMEYIYTTYLLESAEAQGALVVNRPQSLRDANEKMYTAWFPHCSPATLVSRNHGQLRAFIHEHHDTILKPLDGMGGAAIFRLRAGDPNTSVVLETLTHHQQRYIMAQRYIPEIVAGDKRILMVNGSPIPYALARIPAEGETRGNLAAGGRGVGVPLSARDHWICSQVGPALKEKGLLFAGLDVIGDYLTEINVTSPTCIRELDALYSLNIAAELMDVIEDKLKP